MQLKAFKGGYDRNFCYIVYDEKTKEGLIIDPFIDSKIAAFLEEVDVLYITNTHSHFDHVGGNAYFIERGAEVKDEDFIFSGIQVKILKTPGHSSDSKCVLIENNLFTGDTLFVGKIGGTGPYFKTSSSKDQYESLKKLMDLGDDIIVWPGHDYGIKESSTIGFEKKYNPFLRSQNFEEFQYLKDHWEEYKEKHRIE